MISAYLSHPIRGAKGEDATRAGMDANNRRAIEFAIRVRAEFPDLDLYVPAEHDYFVMLAYEMGYLSETQILDVDKLILAERDILIVFSPDGWVGGGVGVEIAEARRLHKPILFTDGTFPVGALLEGL